MGHRRFIAIDQGNTRLKLTLIDDGETKESRGFSPEAMDEVFSTVEQWNPDCGAFCSTGRIDPRTVESLRMALGGRLLVLSRHTTLPIGIDYGTPGTLGLDRVALAAGAARIYPGEGIAIVDAGTAVTLDVVDMDATFRGGRITAGMRLRFEALHTYTAALPLIEADGPVPVAGDTTATAIRSGVVMGLADEITETFRQYKENYGCARLALTGGDAGVLAEHIKTRIPADLVPDLMAQGLLYIYKHNES